MKNCLVTLFMFLVFVSCGEDMVIQDDDRTTVSGHIIDNFSREPIEGANVSIGYGTVEYSYITGTDGNYYIENIFAGGDRYLTVTRKGYKEYEEKIVLCSGIMTFDVFLERLPPLSVDTGRILDSYKDRLDFGSDIGNVVGSFAIINNSDQRVEWEIEHTCSWVETITPEKGILDGGQTTSVLVNIDRTKLAQGNNNAVLNVVSDSPASSIPVHIEAYRYSWD